MPKIFTKKATVGDVIVSEFNTMDNYERSTETLTVTTDMEVGTVFNAADGTVLVAADVGTATAVWILVDNMFDELVTANGDYPLAVIKGGPGGSGNAQIKASGLKYGDALTSGNKATVEALIESQGIKVLYNA